MYVEFEKISEESRLWIYQSNRKITTTEEKEIKKSFGNFLDEWQAHGSDLYAGVEVLNEYFLLIALDESKGAASGCAIDSLVNFVKGIASKLEIDFFDRSKVAFRQSEEVSLVALTEIKTKVKSEEIKPETLLYNTLIAKKSELKENLLIPAGESWAKRYF